MKRAILILEQQSWLGGAQRVLQSVLSSLGEECVPIVAFPGRGPFRAALDTKQIETITCPIGDYRSGRKSWFEMAAFAARSVYCALRLVPVIRKRGASLVYVNGPRCLPAGVLAAKLTGRPCVFHLHSILTRKAEIYLVTCLAKHVSRILTCSRAAAMPLLRADVRLSSKTQVLYNPATIQEQACNPEPQAPPATTRRFTIGMVGRVTEAKGQHVLLKAMGRLGSELRDKTRVLILGAAAPESPEDVRYGEKLRALATQQGLQENIVWTGYQPDPVPFYASMDVLVHAAVYEEAMGLVILEALERGIPVIASRTGGIPEIVEDGSNGLLVAPGDDEALARALTRFLQDDLLRERLRAGVRASLDKRFSFETFSAEIRKLVSEESAA